MCRLIGYVGDPLFLGDLLIDPSPSLLNQSRAAREAKTVVNGDGCGVGWYGERPEPGRYRGVLPAWSDDNLASLCRHIRSGLFIGHVRSATAGDVALSNCHPFAVGRHLFAHNGQIGGYRQLRRRIDALVPDALYGDRAGTTDSEVIFLTALGAGFAERPLEAMAAALSAVLAVAGGLADVEPVRVTALLSDGERLWAFRWSSDRFAPTLYWSRKGKGVVVTSEPIGAEGLDWTAVPAGAVLVAGRDGRADLHPFAPSVAASGR